MNNERRNAEDSVPCLQKCVLSANLTRTNPSFSLFLAMSKNKYGPGWITIDQSVLTAANTRTPRPATGGRGSTTEMSRVKQVTITQAQHQAFKDNVVAHNQLKTVHKELEKQFQNLQKEVSSKDNTIAGHDEEQADNEAEINDLKKQVQTLTQANATKDTEIETLKDELAAADEALRETGTVDESKLNTELVLHTETAAKTFLFRTWKFVENEEDLVHATQDTIPFLQIELEVPENEYITNYKWKVNDALSKGRQYVQSEGKKRAYGTPNNFPVHSIFCMLTQNTCTCSFSDHVSQSGGWSTRLFRRLMIFSQHSTNRPIH